MKQRRMRKGKETKKEDNLLLKLTLVVQKLWYFHQIFLEMASAFVLLGEIVSSCAQTQRKSVRKKRRKKEEQEQDRKKRAGYIKRFPEI